MIAGIILGFSIFIFILGVLTGFRIIQPNERGIILRFGKDIGDAKEGLNWILPFGIDYIRKIDITEQMIDAKPQEIFTMDRVNAIVDAQIYFKVKDDPVSIRASQFNVQDYQYQIVQLARTTLRNIIGGMTLETANSKRGDINKELLNALNDEIAKKEGKKGWGIDLVRAELKEIQPPEDVQESMNAILKAENLKKASKDKAEAVEVEADGYKRAEIKKAEGISQAIKLKANADAEKITKIADADAHAIKVVNESAEKHFTKNAQILKNLQVSEIAYKDNTKIILTQAGLQPPMIILNESNGKKTLPLVVKK